VAQYHQSELTQRDFAEQSGISLSTLQLWLRKSAQSETISAISEAPVSRTQSHWIDTGVLTPTSSPSSAAIELGFPDGVLLKFNSEVDPEQVVQIIRGLR
jgi:transcriptional regulator with XRE-family HTH domain